MLGDSKRVSVFLNKDFSQSFETFVSNNTSNRDLISECKEKFHISSHRKCILFDSKGSELSDEDIEYLNEDEPIFLSQGERFARHSTILLYTLIKPLGKGGFGSVSLYEHKISHKKIAVKKVSLKSLRSPEDINRVYSEITALRELQHPNIVQLYQAIEMKNKICFFMEYCAGGELKGYLSNFGPMKGNLLYSICLQIVGAVRYCHNSNIVHRDLKLENILFTDNSFKHVKIVDFGISGMFVRGSSGEKSDCGSLLYIPPEFYISHSNQANPAQDVWALGCIFYYLLLGVHPFNAPSPEKAVKKIINLAYTPLPEDIPAPWHKLIKGILRKKPEKRWDLTRVQDFLEKYSENPDFRVSSDSEVEEAKTSGLKPETHLGASKPKKQKQGSPSRYKNHLKK